MDENDDEKKRTLDLDDVLGDSDEENVVESDREFSDNEIEQSELKQNIHPPQEEFLDIASPERRPSMSKMPMDVQRINEVRQLFDFRVLYLNINVVLLPQVSTKVNGLLTILTKHNSDIYTKLNSFAQLIELGQEIDQACQIPSFPLQNFVLWYNLYPQGIYFAFMSIFRSHSYFCCLSHYLLFLKHEKLSCASDT